MMRIGRFRSSSSLKPKTSIHSGQCKKHPKHKQSPGVCSLCLTEKLTRVSTSSSSISSYAKARAKAYYYSSSSISSSDDDDDDDDDEDEDSCVSSPASPVHAHHRRIASDLRHTHFDYNTKNDRFSKSKSMAAAVYNGGQDHNKKRVAAPIAGFWSKLLGPKRRSSHVSDITRSQPLASTSTLAVY